MRDHNKKHNYKAQKIAQPAPKKNHNLEHKK